MNRHTFQDLLKKEALILPPLCGYTDFPYRCILAKFGGKIFYTEMVKAKALLRKSAKTMKMVVHGGDGIITGAQLVGCEPEIMAEAAQFCQEKGFSFVDINLGCPVRKVVSKKEGGGLLKDDKQINRILQSVRQSLTIPLTIKTRLGVKKEEINILSIAKMAADAGVEAIAIHGRTLDQFHKGPADWEKIAEVVNTVSVPIIANGGIDSGSMARQVLAQTGAAAVMPGRAVVGNPWLIEDILFHLHGKPQDHPRSKEVVLEIVREHFLNMVQFYNERIACLSMRKFISFYFKGFSGISSLRRKLAFLHTEADFLSLLQEIEEKLPSFQSEAF